MFTERTSVGLDVHARSVAAAAIDGDTGELFQAKLTPSYDHITSWLSDKPGPVAVAYEAGPTGFGLYRHLCAAGIRCEVAAPSKIQKPAGDRVKTDAKDAIHLARRKRLDLAIEQMAAESEFTPLVRRLGCLRGVGTLTGFALAVEIGDWHRFTGNSIGSFVGLVPTEHSSGESRSQGSITTTGNTHVRRLLVEAAWHHKPRYVIGKTMRDRWDLAPAAARIRGDKGNRRLHDRWVRFIARKKKNTIADVAVARELAGWCWSLAVLE